MFSFSSIRTSFAVGPLMLALVATTVAACTAGAGPTDSLSSASTGKSSEPTPAKATASCDGLPVIDCAAPPQGCNYEGGGCVEGAWSCGTLKCSAPDCGPGPGPECAAPPVGCTYLGGGCTEAGWSCGALNCEPPSCDGKPIIDCAAPPQGCNYQGGGCVNGNWTCGTLKCSAPDGTP